MAQHPQRAAAAAATFMQGRDDGRPFQHSHVPAEHAALMQSRETGDVIPEDAPRGQVKALPFAKSWMHFMAGGYVGLLAARPLLVAERAA